MSRRDLKRDMGPAALLVAADRSIAAVLDEVGRA